MVTGGEVSVVWQKLLERVQVKHLADDSVDHLGDGLLQHRLDLAHNVTPVFIEETVSGVT